MAKSEITMNIIKEYGVVATKSYDKTDWKGDKQKHHHDDELRLQLISWNGAAPAINLRWWYRIDNGEWKCGTGEVLNEEQATMLQFGLEQAITDLATASQATA